MPNWFAARSYRIAKSRLRARAILACAAVCIAAPSFAQTPSTWTNLGDTPDFFDPYNWSTFPVVPGNGGEVILNGPHRSQLSISLSQNVTLSRVANVGSLSMRITGGQGSITLVSQAELDFRLKPLGSPALLRWTEDIAQPIGGSAGITKVGGGALQLSATSSFRGDVRVLDGWLVPTNQALGAAENRVHLSGGGIVGTANLSQRVIHIGSGGGTLHAANAGTFGEVTGNGPLVLDSDANDASEVKFISTVTHTGTTTVLGNARLKPGANGAHGRLSGTRLVAVVGNFVVGNGFDDAPSDCINDLATIALRGGAARFENASGPPEVIDQLHLERGRGLTGGSFTASRLVRAMSATWRIDGASRPRFLEAPQLLGDGAVGSPSVGILPYAANASQSTAAPVTYDSGFIRPLDASEQMTFAALPSPQSPEVNLRISNETITSPISVKSLHATTGSVHGATITINGGGVYSSSGGTISCALDFGAAEGLIHGRAVTTGTISGSGGLTISGSASLRGESDYTGETNVNGSVAVVGSVLAGQPSPLGLDTSPVNIWGTSGTPGSLELLVGGPEPVRFERSLRFHGEGRDSASIGKTGAAAPIHLAGEINTLGPLRIGNLESIFELEGVISGPGFVSTISGATTTFRRANTYTGGTSLAGRVRIDSESPFGTGTVWLEPQVALEALSQPRQVDNEVQFAGTALSLVFVGTQPLSFSSPFVLHGPATINCAASAPLSFTAVVNHPLTTSGAGTLQLAWYRGRGLDARSGRLKFLPAQNEISSRAESLRIATTAVVDLNDHTLVLDRGGGTLGESGVRSYLAGGRLVSSIALDTPGTGIGYALAGQALNIEADAPPQLFDGQLVRPHDLLICTTLLGDANLDRTVNIADFANLAANFGLSSRVWWQGDFNYDSLVTTADFALMSASFNQSLNASRIAVPEATGAVVGAILAIGLRWRR